MQASRRPETPRTNHYGTVLPPGDGAAWATMAAFASLPSGTNFVQVLLEPPFPASIGGHGVPAARHRQTTLHSADADALATVFGIDPTRP